ncbi:HIT family protein [Solidesulfovibrio sp.]
MITSPSRWTETSSKPSSRESSKRPAQPIADAARSRIVEEFDSVFAIPDGYPVSAGHQLVITKRHTPDWFAMTQAERNDADSLLRILKNRLTEDDRSITGFNIGMNSGASAGQTVFHVHIHLIPRRDGDTENPCSGVRGVIPGKMNYLKGSNRIGY